MLNIVSQNCDVFPIFGTLYSRVLIDFSVARNFFVRLLNYTTTHFKTVDRSFYVIMLMLISMLLFV